MDFELWISAAELRIGLIDIALRIECCIQREEKEKADCLF